MLRIELLGSPKLLYLERELVLPRKAVALLAYLALEGRTERGKAVDLLWGAQDEAEGRHSLRQILYQLGKTPLEAHLSAGRSQLELNHHFGLDVAEFQQRVSLQKWSEALTVYRGEFLQGLELEEEAYAVWLRHQRERLGRLYAAALEGQAKQLQTEGQTQQALGLYLELIRHDELQEQFHREAMRLFAALGQTEQALGLYGRFCEILGRELALEPLPETQALAEQIRQRKAVAGVQPQAPHSPSFKPPLVGRAAALGKLEAAWQRKNILLVAGPAGVGKSRLVEEFLADKGRYVTLSGRPGDGQTPYASMTRWVRQALAANPNLKPKRWVRLEASRLVPDLSDTPPPALDESSQVRFFSALVELISQAHGCTTYLSEDEHFSDPWSLKALAVGLGQGSVTRLVATVRPDEVLPGVAQRHQDWRSSGTAEWFELEPLSELEVAELIGQLSGRPARLFPQRVYRATAGNPLFVLETLRSLFESGELRLGEGGVWETAYDEATHDYAELSIAPSVRQTILGRLERQGAAVGRSLEVAALIADATFDSKTLAEATALSNWEVSEALERASQARLIEAAAQGYRFTHDLIARTISEAIKPDRRRLISARLAQHYAEQALHPAKVAGYFQAAGQPEQAIQWWLKAAFQAHGLRAFGEADAYYLLALGAMSPEHPKHFEALTQRFYLSRQVGIASLEEQLEQLQTMQQSARTALQRSHVWFYRGMVLDDQQDLEGAMQASRKAYAFALEVSAAEAFYPLVFVTHYQRDLGLLEEALHDGQKVLELSQNLSPFYLVEAQLCHSLTLMLKEQQEQALKLLEQAETLMQQHSPAPSGFWLLQERIGVVRARVLNSVGRFVEAIPQIEAIVEKSRQAGVQRQELIALLVRAEAWLGAGQTAEATQDLERSLELAHHLNWGWSEVRQLYAELELAQHNPRAALRQAEQAFEASRNNWVHQINALYSRGGAWLAIGEQAKAKADLEQALTLHANIARSRSVNQKAIQTRLAMTLQ